MVYQAENSEANIYQRIASGDEKTVNSAIQILDEYGLPQPTSRKGLAKSLIEAVGIYGDPAYRKIIHIHPDREAIISNIAPALKHHNDCGCNKNDTGHHNDCGCNKNDVGVISAAGTKTSEKASISTEPTKFDIQHFAMILVLTIGGISFFTMLVGQTFLHMKSINK